MRGTELYLSENNVYKLLSAASGDAVLLYLYISSGNDPAAAATQLQLSQSRLQCAQATLRQLGLWEEKKTAIPLGERPAYSETDVVRAMDHDGEFQHLYGEIQHLMGRALNTEELKILLGIIRYLGMPAEVVSLLVRYCQERARRKGSTRAPSLRTIEKESYAWAERGIDTMEEAIAYVQSQSIRYTRLGRLMELLQIRGRSLTAAEERYAQQWLDWGFDEDAISIAYERTCLNTGGLNWAYMNKILSRWQEAGLLTAQQIKAGDKKPVPKGASGELGEAELAAIQRMLAGGIVNGIQ